MIPSRALESESGRGDSNIDASIKELIRKNGSRTLAKSCQSGSGSQGSTINVLDKEINKTIIASRALAKS